MLNYITKKQYRKKIVNISVQYFLALYLIGSAEEGFSSVHLYQDATQGPHVDGQIIRHSQQHLWGTVEATLDILIYLQKEIIYT